MKIASILILIIGLLMTFSSGFTYVTKEKVADLGALEITKDNQHNIHWRPYAGIGMIVIGGIMYMFDRKKTGIR